MSEAVVIEKRLLSELVDTQWALACKQRASRLYGTGWKQSPQYKVYAEAKALIEAIAEVSND